MESAFDRAIVKLIELEHGDRVAWHKNDRGGPARYGITEAVARANGYAGPMTQLPVAIAMRIAHAQYWDIMSLDQVAVLSERLAYELFETGYRIEQGVAACLLQRWLNVLNRQAHEYGPLRVDGLVGPMTLHSLRTFFDRRADAEALLLRGLSGSLAERRLELAEADPTSELAIADWLRRRGGV